MNEADTCRRCVIPRLQQAGWDNEPHAIAEPRTITDGRIVPVGQGFVRKPPKRVDYLLRYTRDFPLAVVEAKASQCRAKSNPGFSGAGSNPRRASAWNRGQGRSHNKPAAVGTGEITVTA